MQNKRIVEERLILKKFLAVLMTLSTVVVQSGGIANAEVYDRIAACKAAACRYCAELNAGDASDKDANERASLLPNDCRDLVNPDDSLYDQREACNSLIQICKTSKKSLLPTWEQLQAAAAGTIVTIGLTLFYHVVNAALGRAGNVNGNVNGAGNANAVAPVVQQAALNVNAVVDWIAQVMGGAPPRGTQWRIGDVRLVLANHVGSREHTFIGANMNAVVDALKAVGRKWIRPNVVSLF